MNTYHEDHSQDPFITASASAQPWTATEHIDRPTRPHLAEGWRRLATGMRGTQLYRFTPISGTGGCWVAVMTINGKLLSRRFAAELHARAWLTIVVEPRTTSAHIDLEELNGPFRAAALLREG